MKKNVFLLLVVLTVLPVTVFAAGAREGAASGKVTIGLALPDLQLPFFATMKSEVDTTAVKLGVKVVSIDAQNDPARQAAAMESLVAQKVSGILVSPMTPDSLVPSIQAAVKAGIPVASVNRKANTDAVLVHVGSDNEEGGRAAARYVVDTLKTRGTVIELEGTPGAPSAVDRKKGFDAVIVQNPGIKILVSQAADFNRAKANSVMLSLMQAYPKFDAVFAANDEMVIGAIEAMSAAGVEASTKVTVGYGATPDGMSFIKQGKLRATIDELPGKQASLALQYLVDYIRNRTQPPQRVMYLVPGTVTSAP